MPVHRAEKSGEMPDPAFESLAYGEGETVMLGITLRRHLCLFLTVIAFWTFQCAAEAEAETPVGSNVDSRVLVGVSASADTVQTFLPEGWSSVPFPSGPLGGANLLLVFIDSLVQYDAEGKPLAPASRRAVALVSLGKQTTGDEVRLFVLRIYTTTPEVDPYKVNLAAEISRKSSVEGPANGGRARSDTWEVEVSSGGTLSFQLDYKTGTPSWTPGEAFPHSASVPDFSRIYRFRQMVDLVASTSLGKPSSGEFSLKSSVPELGSLLDGSEEIVAVMDVPVYVREIWLP